MGVNHIARWGKQIEADFVQQRRRERKPPPSKGEIYLHVVATMQAVKAAADRGDQGIADARAGAERRRKQSPGYVSRQNLQFLRDGLDSPRIRRADGGAANSGPARVTYDIPDGTGRTNLTIESDGVGRRSREFTYEGRRYVLSVEFVSEGNKYRAKAVTIDRA